MPTTNITNPNSHPDFSPPTFGVIDFGVPANGIFSVGYKMVAFEPGKVLQAQELNEIQFRMSIHQSLTMQMMSNWLNELIISGTEDCTGPGWDGATPIKPTDLFYSPGSDNLSIKQDNWYLCKANSSGLFFWLYIKTPNNIQIDTSTIENNQYVGFNLNTSANGEYTGELVNCKTVGTALVQIKHPLNIKNSSVCGSSRYYLRITGITSSNEPITNNFVALAQKRTNGVTTSFYYLNNIKVREA